ncbi:MAG: hypothetical protein AAF806_30570 [Bacteroidota bacterium]
MIESISALRKELHQYPELSGKEEQTANRIVDSLQLHHPPIKILRNVGGHGVLAIYEFSKEGKTVGAN